jgi:hypothetical protein
MATTPATSVHSSTLKRNGIKLEDIDESPSEGVITQEMFKEESDLHESSLQKDLADSSSQVAPSHGKMLTKR